MDVSNIQRQENVNCQNCLMKIVEYNNYHDIIVEFQDEHKAKVHTQYNNFKRGQVKNPYYPSIFNVGIIGNKYPINTKDANNKFIKLKEYNTWIGILERCYSEKYRSSHSTYKDVIVCNEWLFYENFYEWLHSQENFDKWLNEKKWDIDKDILVKGNNIYSPDTCCLVPQNVNVLFTKCDKSRNALLPIGVYRHNEKFRAICQNPFKNKSKHIGMYETLESAFYSGYKPYKESIIKQVAEIEYIKGNITRKCYEAMMKYEVEITD